MKTLALAFLLVAVAFPLRADDWLVNGDFSDGLRGWHGEGHSADEDSNAESSENPLATPSASAAPTPKGLILKLRSEWVKESQDFTMKSPNARVKVTYVINPSTTFSTDQKDYTNIPDQIGWNAWRSFDTHPNSFLVFVSDAANPKGSSYEPVEPNMNSNQEQTFEMPLEREVAGEDATIAVAFPPGTGSVTIHSITVTSQ